MSRLLGDVLKHDQRDKSSDLPCQDMSCARARASVRRWSSFGRLSPIRQVAAVTLVFVVSTAVFFLAGVRLDLGPLTGRGSMWWQTLDPSLLQHHLLSSLWYLHSQPPLFNAFFGILLKLPTELRLPTAVLCYWTMGWILAVSCFLLLKELGISAGAALVVTTFVVVSPDVVLYENLLFYTYPTAVLITVAAFCLVRYVRSQSCRYGAGYFVSVALIILLNSTFQWPWLFLVCAPLLVLRRHRNRSLRLCAVPLMLVLAWYAKNAAIFGTYSTSSWLGMNLDKITVLAAPPQQIRNLIVHKELTPLASVRPFRDPTAYVPHFTSFHKTGVPALDERLKRDGSPNFNNLIYVGVSADYLRNDLHYIELAPLRYAKNVVRASEIFLEPADQYGYVGQNYSHIAGYARFFDAEFELQPGRPTNSLFPGVAHIAYEKLAEIVITLFGVPWLIWRRRRDVITTIGLGFVWLSVVYVIVVVNLVELGENNRFRLDFGPLPLIAAVVVVAAAIGRLGESSSAGPPSDNPIRTSIAGAGGMTVHQPVEL